MSKYVYFEVNCIEVEQPIGTFFVASMSSQDLVHISYSDVRALRDRDLDQYLGIERELSASRVTDLSKYVQLVDATFPTSVILAIASVDEEGEGEDQYIIRFDQEKRTLRIRRDKNIAKIIDGQHRIAGLENYNNTDFELNVAIFVDMDIEDQAMVFATINLKQAKVSKSLQYDLYELAKSRSPQKTCHNIARLLNKKEGSPFYRRIKVLGKAEGPMETITQASFVDKLLPYISRDPMIDRDLLKRNKLISTASEKEMARLIFRNLFVDGKDEIISRIVWNYFSAVSKRWPIAWNQLRPGHILNRTTGFSALMEFLRPAYLKLRKDDASIIEESEFLALLATIELDDESFTVDTFNPGSSGVSALRKQLLSLSGLG